MTPAERKALHDTLDGLINAGARITLAAWLFESSSTVAQVASAQAALDGFALAVEDDIELVEVLGNSTTAVMPSGECDIDLVFYPKHRPEFEGVQYGSAEILDVLRSHPGYLLPQPQHIPSSPAITYPPGRADRHL